MLYLDVMLDHDAIAGMDFSNKLSVVCESLLIDIPTTLANIGDLSFDSERFVADLERWLSNMTAQ